jgi:hypothetical protein
MWNHIEVQIFIFNFSYLFIFIYFQTFLYIDVVYIKVIGLSII